MHLVCRNQIRRRRRRRANYVQSTIHDMDNTYHLVPPETQQLLGYNGGYLETLPPDTANRPPLSNTAHEAARPDHTATQWTPSRECDGNPYGYRSGLPPPAPGGAFGSSSFALPYGFDPSIPPPPFCPPPSPFHNSIFHTVPQHFRPGPQATRYDSDPSQRQQRDYEGFSETRAVLGYPQAHNRDRNPTAVTRPEDETALQSRQDQQWISRFLQCREKTSKTPTSQQLPQHSPVPDLRDALNGAAQLVSQLAESCETLRNNLNNESVWTDSYLMAITVKRELRDRIKVLSDNTCLDRWKAKLSRVARRRTRRLRARKLLQIEESHREAGLAEKEAAIEKWWKHQIEQVEERKRERELKLAADSVLCEVRKKQADVKRMQDILTSLEKLRRLRKEAASRKGITIELECDEAFSSRLEQLRCVMKKRTTVYSAEENALMVMLEGEQEEEKRKEREKQVKKERETHLQRQRRVNGMLFGDDLPVDSVLQPFREYYTRAECSLHALLQIRKEWDVFVVAANHSVGSALPQSWILPDAPSDQAWASALHTTETE